jgi:hypothetical protein
MTQEEDETQIYYVKREIKIIIAKSIGLGFVLGITVGALLG